MVKLLPFVGEVHCDGDLETTVPTLGPPRYYAERVIPVGPLTWNAEPTLVAGSGTARFGDHSIHLKELQSWLRPSDRAFMDPTIPTIATIYESGDQT